MLRKGKIIVYSIWVLLTVGLITTYFIYPEFFTPEYLTSFIKKFTNEMLFIYILLTFIRGFFLIPSTPFVIAGGLLFPDRLLLVLGISLAGIMFSATALYYFSDLLGFSKHLNKKFPSKIDLWKSRLENSKSILFIAGWSLFPFVPTDLICYVTGVLKTPFKNMFLGVFIGEIILCSIYIFFGSSIFNLL
ncbi:VTT domain-containing protein [Pseudotenacibaculum sp. MALMAid0570]|uniref:TVP38/TMEM64 family protein n=1 Tax=Pseudotenacibaculum sp. MALMAid0570 TaxID=3143938 RepID=UPI0032DFF449